MQNSSSRLTTLSLAVAISAAGSGCVGTGPNTQQGAVTGATIGAIAGAVIGNNSGHRTVEGAAIGGAVGAIAGGTLGNAADHEQGTLYTWPPQHVKTLEVSQPPPPPPPRAEVVVGHIRHGHTAVWINGYWLYDGRGYVWIAGHWEVPPPQCRVYYPPRWERRPAGAYVYVRGYWR